MKKIYFLCIALWSSMTAFGAQITVMNTSDSGPGSLRDAISSAAGGDEIIFDGSIAGSLIGLTSSITIDKNLTISGSVGNAMTISTGMQARVFSISSPFMVSISWIDFSDNSSSSGGAIINSGTLSISNCNFTNNVSEVNGSAHGGGAVYNNTNAELVIDHCVFESNSVVPKQPATNTISYVQGGAIYHRGAYMAVNNSYFANNIANYISGNTNGSAIGGAIYALRPGDISTCTFYNNSAIGSDNLSGGLGGALYAFNNSGTVGVLFSTFSDNEASGNNSSSWGGTICNDGHIFLKSSIVANGNSDPGAENFYTFSGKTAVSAGGNIMDDWTNSGITLDATDLTGDPLLQAPTIINSSFTKVLPIDCSSPAIDAGNGTGAPSTDQVNQARVFGSGIDIGAYEQHSTIPAVTAAASSPDICMGESSTVTASVSGGGTSSYTWDNGLGTGQAHNVSPTTTTTYTVTATNSGGCTGTSTVTVTVNPLPSVTMGAVDTTCLNDNPIPLTGSPSGGTFAGPGISGSEFDPGTAGVGSHTLTYTYQDANGCENTANQVIIVDGCASIEEESAAYKLYPNPAHSYFQIQAPNAINNVKVFSALGKEVQNLSIKELGQKKIIVTTNHLNRGTYLVQFTTVNGVYTQKVIIF